MVGGGKVRQERPGHVLGSMTWAGLSPNGREGGIFTDEGLEVELITSAGESWLCLNRGRIQTG